MQAKEFTSQQEENSAEFHAIQKLENNTEICNASGDLVCVNCDFKSPDQELFQTHLASSTSEHANLREIMIYQKSAKLFHCQQCFFTSRLYRNVYHHVVEQHINLIKKGNEEASQTTESHARIARGRKKRTSKKELEVHKMIEGKKSKKGGRKSLKQPREANTSDLQPSKKKPRKQKHMIKKDYSSEDSKSRSTDFNCETCGFQFSSVNELNGHCCKKKIKKKVNAQHFEFEYCDYSGRYPIESGSGSKSTVSGKPEEPAEENIKKEDEPSEEKKKEKSLAENVKYVRGTFFCNSCNFRCKSKGSALYHVVVKHNKPYPYQCSVCGKYFVIDQVLKRHMSVHTGEPYYKCSYCDFESDYARAYKNHEKQCNPELRKNASSENTGTNKQLNAEVKLTNSVPSFVPSHSSHKQVEQMDGNSVAKIESSKAIMLTESSKNDSELKSGKMGKMETSKLRLLVTAKCGAGHQEDSSSSKDNILTCDKSGKKSDQQSAYNKHKPILARQKHLSCGYCELSFGDVTALSDHVSALHAERKTFGCDRCSAKFDRQGDLQHHIKVHKQNNSKSNQSGDIDDRKLYKCQYCPYSSYLFANYKRHVRTIHTEDFLIFCPFCKGGFNLPSELKKHKCQQIQDENIQSNQ
ncbi:chromosome alignment-maintaining phosphoprotein 1-like [Callorhinchus milii]|uniref:chromosome alignment-maintaining phosphoprotein 1-like n=1 Tax=Callorhinchus milii TaxID=7868 RepID=UPI001C3F5D5A|nr:chromosome alignment-maintaining phosphoprotein 1-like [Callorhinchus milii]